MTWLRYGWRVIVNLFYLAIVLFVFDRLGAKPDLSIIISILGIIYVTIRSIGIGLAITTMEAAPMFLRKLNYILKNQGDLDGHESGDTLAEAEKIKSQQTIKFYIDGFFLGLISLVCLLVLFSNLPAKYGQ